MNFGVKRSSRNHCAKLFSAVLVLVWLFPFRLIDFINVIWSFLSLLICSLTSSGVRGTSSISSSSVTSSDSEISVGLITAIPSSGYSSVSLNPMITSLNFTSSFKIRSYASSNVNTVRG